MKMKLLTNITRMCNKIVFNTKKHSPEILMIAGIGGTVVSAVMACKETLKLDEVLADTKEDLAKIDVYVETKGFSEVYTESDRNKDLAKTYVKAGLKVLRNYAPSIILGGLSISAILSSNNILKKRNTALAAAYVTVDNAYKKYRERVVDRFGEQVDRELKNNIRIEEVKETIIDENGKKKTIKNKIEVIDDEPSEYAKFYTAGCKGWVKDPEANRVFLATQQKYANIKLKTQGYLFLNDVYESLGIPKTTAGQVVGWLYDPFSDEIDNKVDFGIFDVNKPANQDFINGYEPTILLDFNVDGPIIDDFWKLGLDSVGSGC